jgi:hypothetical protein
VCHSPPGVVCGWALELFPGNGFNGYLVVRVQAHGDERVCVAAEDTLYSNSPDIWIVSAIAHEGRLAVSPTDLGTRVPGRRQLVLPLDV